MYKYKYKYFSKYGPIDPTMMPPYLISQQEIPAANVEGEGDPNKPIYFYEHTGERGNYFILKAGQKTKYVGDYWNDRISSILIPPSTIAKTYKDANYLKRISDLSSFELGESPTIPFTNSDSSRWRLIDLNQNSRLYEKTNDTISSIETEKLPET